MIIIRMERKYYVSLFLYLLSFSSLHPQVKKRITITQIYIKKIINVPVISKAKHFDGLFHRLNHVFASIKEMDCL